MPMPYFKIDNDIFSLRLGSYEFQIYSYLVSCAGKKGECWPSTNTIARTLDISQSTVICKIDSLVRRQLIDKRTTIRHSKSGRVSTGNNHYYIRSVAEAKMAHERFPGGHGGLGGTLTDEEDI
ncbi:MAG: helix-turn-helix domain-containing protein [Firmicutes bacterium]|nr:helix-turn-helix domain-containing protein [Bacillota bacterium]